MGLVLIGTERVVGEALVSLGWESGGIDLAESQ